MLALPDSYLALGGLAVAIVIAVLVVMAFRTRGDRRQDHSVSPPPDGQQDFRKPHA